MSRYRKFTTMCCAAVFALGLAACGGGGGGGTTVTPTPDPAIAQRADVNMKISTAQTTVSGINDTSTDAQVTAADNAVTAATSAVSGASALDANEKAAFNTAISAIQSDLNSRKSSRKTAMDAADEADKMVMMATAMKLHAGIGAPNTTTGDAAQRQAAYTGTDNVDITVTWGAADTAQILTVDEDATVADRDGWTGQMFTAKPANAGTYEAVVYSHVGEPTVTKGAKFNATYTLDATTGETAAVTGLAGHTTGRVASPSFDQDAGEKTFKPGTNEQRIVLGGSYQGVSGTYYCTATDRAVGCSATVADEGFILGGGTWTFKPTNPETALMDTSVPDNEYASYGWWLHKSEDGKTFVASAFRAYRGTPATVDITNLRGTATYKGGAVGKYALQSLTGGTNDAGHFTADVELNATFAATAHKVSGTIDNFVGADDKMRDWSVALSESVISTGGLISGALAADGTPSTTDTGAQMTTWTIGGTAADADGQWSGNLLETGDDDVPAIATGTFYSTYGQDGRMVGAFGVNKQ